MLLPPSPNGNDGHGPPPRTSRNASWPCELIDRLKALWDEKRLSAAQMAQQLGISRNAVLGKVHRLGLATHKSRPNTRPRKPIAPVKKLPVVIAIVDQAPPAEPKFLGLTLMQLKETSCRYPRGEQAPFEYCGQMQQKGSSYCSFHHEQCYFAASSRMKFAIPAPWVDYRGNSR